MRKSGILLHISSLPGRYGIGTFGKEAKQFVDKLEASKQQVWQILPIGPTSYGDSPYQSFSSYALNPYFIDLEVLTLEGLLSKDELSHLRDDLDVDYGYLYETRYEVLKLAYTRFDFNHPEYIKFEREQAFWLEDYALFMAIKKHFNDDSWASWPLDLKMRKEAVLAHYRHTLKETIQFHKFLQFQACKQWFELKNYANDKGIEIVGDMPIYVAFDSADVWTMPKVFQLDDNYMMTHVAGVPPDPFTEDGQLWGNPLYDWQYLKETNYAFWVSRMKVAALRFDVIRIDHFIGFVNFYKIPAADSHAKNGVWVKGPGYDLFRVLDKKLGTLNIIAEDLGAVTQEVIDLIKKTGFPGMKLLQFGMDCDATNPHITHNHPQNAVVYTGTHDNDTSSAWIKTLDKKSYEYLKAYINEHNDQYVLKAFIKETLSSVASLVVIPMQDYLELGTEARMNFPSKIGNNWSWRMKAGAFSDEVAEFISAQTVLYGRDKKSEKDEK